ncbi:MAG: pilus assembly protein [Deltaproteobacteria bacterium]|nr:pilus assembly protein [Deltaproteobacteria bacterium]
MGHIGVTKGKAYSSSKQYPTFARGTTMVEFALTLPFFLFFIFLPVVEFGFFFYRVNTLQYALDRSFQEASRWPNNINIAGVLANSNMTWTQATGFWNATGCLATNYQPISSDPRTCFFIGRLLENANTFVSPFLFGNNVNDIPPSSLSLCDQGNTPCLEINNGAIFSNESTITTVIFLFPYRPVVLGWLRNPINVRLTSTARLEVKPAV